MRFVDKKAITIGCTPCPTASLPNHDPDLNA
jgi:hypothetical protein